MSHLLARPELQSSLLLSLPTCMLPTNLSQITTHHLAPRHSLPPPLLSLPEHATPYPLPPASLPTTYLTPYPLPTTHYPPPTQDPFLAIVVDPMRTMAAGKVELGAFRTYPDNYSPPDEGPSEYQSIPMDKIEVGAGVGMGRGGVVQGSVV